MVYRVEKTIQGGAICIICLYSYIYIYIHVRFSIMKKNTEDEKPTNVGVNH